MIQFLTLVTLSLYARTPVPQMTPLDPGENKWRFTCSVVMISSNEALTAAHCVNGPEKNELKVRTYSNTEYMARVVAIDAQKDLALIKIAVRLPQHAKLAHSVHRGDKVLIMSSEDDMPGTYGEGMVQNIVLDPETACPQIVHTIPILGGASGSGLFNDRGELIGINVSRQAGTSYATETLQIRHFLEDHYQYISLKH